MVDAALADELTAAVREAAVPENAFAAEQLLAALLGTRLPTLEQAPFTDRARAALRCVLRDAEYEAGETGAYEESGARAETGAPIGAGAPGDEPKPEVGDLARAVSGTHRYGPPVGGGGRRRPRASYPLAHTRAPPGSGRLLWMCVRMATAPHPPRLVPRMWHAARARGIDAPDWLGDPAVERCDRHPSHRRRRGTTLLMPPDDPSDISAGNSGAAVFTRGGDGVVGGVRGEAFLTPAPGRPG